MGISLLFGERRSSLNATHRVRDSAIERRPAGPEPEGGDHQPGIPEYQLCLDQAQPFLLTHKTFGIHINAFERHRSRVAAANAVLVLRFPVTQAGSILFDYKPGWPPGRSSQNGIQVGIASIADPLLVSGNFVPGNLSILHDGICHSPKCSQITSSLRFCGSIGHEQPLLADARQPELLLFIGAAEDNRVASKKGGQNSGRDSKIDTGQFLTHPVNVKGAPTHALKLLRNEEELNTQSGTAHFPYNLNRKFFLSVKFQDLLFGQPRSRKVL